MKLISHLIRDSVVVVLENNDRWMSANEIVNAGDMNGLYGLMKKDKKPYAHSHPVFRILTGMVNNDNLNIYTPEVKRRKRGEIYEYSLKGMKHTIKRIINSI